MSPAYQCDSKLICRCLGVTEDDLVDAVCERQLQSLQEVVRQTGAGAGCTACRKQIMQYLSQSK